jgi:glyoxalase family protein
MTFFAWPGAHRGRIGPPQVTTTAFLVSSNALDYWSTRLTEKHVAWKWADERFGERCLTFNDPDAMQLELIGESNPSGQPWGNGPVPAAQAIRGFHGVTLMEEGYERTAKLLTGLMGFESGPSERNRFRYRSVEKSLGSCVDLLCVPDAQHGAMGAGVVHHVAFRVSDDPTQERWQKKIADAGLNVSPVMDRSYFHSIYFREPGGVLFEIATESPGFTMDESVEALGSGLKLPPWLQPHQGEIERALPPLRRPVSK